MKKVLVFLTALLMICSISLAEDAVTSATLSVDRLPAVESTGSSVLVAYFSTDDTVRAAAYTAADALSADLFEIQPAEPYTADDLNYRNRQSRTSILGHIDIGQEELKSILGSGDAAVTLSVTP